MHIESLSFFPLSDIEALHFVIMNDINELMQIETKIRTKEKRRRRKDWFSPVCIILSYGSWSANVAVIDLPSFVVIVSVMSVNVTDTNTGVIFADGHVKPCVGVVIALVVTSNVPLPFVVVNVSEPVTVVAVLFRPLGSLFPGGVKHPCVTSAVALNVASPPVPAPATSPVADNEADVTLPNSSTTLLTVRSGCPTKCRPRSFVVLVGAIANAPDESNAGAISSKAVAIAAVGMPIFLMLSDIFPRVIVTTKVNTGFATII